MPAPAIVAPSLSTRASRSFGSEPIARRMPHSRVRALTENANTPATPTMAIIIGAPPENARVQAVRRKHLRPHILERRCPLHRLLGGQCAGETAPRHGADG